MRRENSLERSIIGMLGMGGGTRKRGRPRARSPCDTNAVTNCTLAELCMRFRKRSKCVEEDDHGNYQKSDATLSFVTLTLNKSICICMYLYLTGQGNKVESTSVGRPYCVAF